MKQFIASLFTVILPITVSAQQFHFDEMEYSPRQTTFRVFAPTKANTVKLRIYKEGLGGNALHTVNMKRTKTSTDDHSGRGAVWTATVPGDHIGRYYTFDTGHGETPGVFAKAVGVNGRRAAIIDRSTTDPTDWDKDQRPLLASPADQVIYELHHRDFSINRRDARNPGKFLALTEPWAINHLKSLGINAVHLLPSYDYGSVDESQPDKPQYNWGYDPVNYNVPEGSYSTDATTPEVRIREFKQMVQALHNAGIRVILDVVYNHTYDIEHSNFQRTFPDYYYRKADGAYSNGSGCGNETASEQPMMRRFMLESVKYWIQEYHIDGFRFDLMGCHDIETMNQIRQAVDELDPTIFIYGEGWSAGQCALPTEQLATKANVSQMPRIAAFGDEMRDALRGPFDDDAKGAFLAALPGSEESLKFGICGCISHPQVNMSKVNYSTQAWASEPTQALSYVSCHDDMCLTDRLRASIPSLTEDELIRLDQLAQTAVFTSQGIPFMLCGEELLRTKQGVHNSFESPDSINQLDWSNLRRYPLVMNYYRDLIRLRSHHPAFRLGSAEMVRRHLEFLKAPSCVVAFRLRGHAGGDSWNNIIVVLNANTTAQTVNIPEGTYTVVASSGIIYEYSTRQITGRQVTVSPQSALILHD